MRKIDLAKIALSLSGLLLSGMAMGQTANDVIKTKFPETAGELAINDGTQYNPALKVKYRELYSKMGAGLGEIEKFELGGAEAEILEVFDIKTLKDMQKAGSLSDLKSGLLSEQHKISKLMREEKYGADSANCIRQLSMYSEYTKQNNYTDAYPSWSLLFNNFPKCSQNIYSGGVTIVKYKMKDCKTRAEQELWIDTLMMVYDQRIKYFAATSKNYGEAYLLGRKGVDLLKYRKTPLEEPYNILMKAVDLGKNNTELAVIQTAMQAVIGMYEAQKIDAAVVVDRYLQLCDILAAEKANFNQQIASAANDKAKTEATNNLNTANQVQAAIDQGFSNSTAAQCETLNKAFEPRFKENPNDAELCDKIIKILGSKGCTDLQLYEDVVSKMVENNPTEQSCAGFAKMLDKKGKFDEAVSYYEKAIGLATADSAKSGYNLLVATMYLGKKQYQSACSYARKAVALNGNCGMGYIIIASSYAAIPVGEDAFERSKTYWVVIDKLNKAKAVDPSVAATAQKLINQFIGSCPKKEEAFMHSVTPGTTVTVGGWIGETTTARF